MKYKVNDIIIDKYDYKRKILEVFTQTYVVSTQNHFNETACVATEQELDVLGYTLYQEPKPKIVWGSPESYSKRYWAISCGDIYDVKWTGSSYDIFRRKVNNVFDTREECEARLKEIMES